MKKILIVVFLFLLINYIFSSTVTFNTNTTPGLLINGYFTTTDQNCQYQYLSEGICLKTDYNYSNYSCNGIDQNGVCVRARTRLMNNESCEICSLCSSKPVLFGLSSCNEMFCNSLPLCSYSSGICVSQPVCSSCGNGICDTDETIITCSTDCTLNPCGNDGFCNYACLPGVDPDCSLPSPICGNGVVENIEECEFDSNCELNEICSGCLCVSNCADDDYCNVECSEGTDPDCLIDPCLEDGFCNPVCPIGVDPDCGSCFMDGLSCISDSNCCSNNCENNFCATDSGDQKNSISVLDASYKSNTLSLSLECLFDADSNLSVVDVNKDLVYFENTFCSSNLEEVSFILSLEGDKTYSIVSKINAPCQVCSREVFVYVPKEQKSSIPDGNIFSLILVVFIVLFVLIQKERV